LCTHEEAQHTTGREARKLAGKKWCEPTELSTVCLTVSGTNAMQNPDKSAVEQIPAHKILYIPKPSEMI